MKLRLFFVAFGITICASNNLKPGSKQNERTVYGGDMIVTRNSDLLEDVARSLLSDESLSSTMKRKLKQMLKSLKILKLDNGNNKKHNILRGGDDDDELDRTQTRYNDPDRTETEKVRNDVNYMLQDLEDYITKDFRIPNINYHKDGKNRISFDERRDRDDHVKGRVYDRRDRERNDGDRKDDEERDDNRRDRYDNRSDRERNDDDRNRDKYTFVRNNDRRDKHNDYDSRDRQRGYDDDRRNRDDDRRDRESTRYGTYQDVTGTGNIDLRRNNNNNLRCACSNNDLRCGCGGSKNDLRCACSNDDLRCGCSNNDLRCSCLNNDLRCGCRGSSNDLRCDKCDGFDNIENINNNVQNLINSLLKQLNDVVNDKVINNEVYRKPKTIKSFIVGSNDLDRTLNQIYNVRVKDEDVIGVRTYPPKYKDNGIMLLKLPSRTNNNKPIVRLINDLKGTGIRVKTYPTGNDDGKMVFILQGTPDDIVKAGAEINKLVSHLRLQKDIPTNLYLEYMGNPSMTFKILKDHVDLDDGEKKFLKSANESKNHSEYTESDIWEAWKNYFSRNNVIKPQISFKRHPLASDQLISTFRNIAAKSHRKSGNGATSANQTKKQLKNANHKRQNRSRKSQVQYGFPFHLQLEGLGQVKTK